jgi:hypothetical protein
MRAFRITVVYPLTTIWLAIFVWAGISFIKDAPIQIQKDKDFIKQQINPNVVTVDSFKTINRRLPSVKEFEQIKQGNSGYLGNQIYIRDSNLVAKEIKEKVKGMNWANDYVIGVWRGEWMEYYISRNHEYITNNYNLKDGYKDMAFSFIVAIVPLLIVLISRNRRLKRVFV